MNDSLYREQLLDVCKNPSNRGELSQKSIEVTETNPFCGDALTLQLLIKKGVIKDVAFDGDVCMVAIASASLLTEELKGKSLTEARGVTKADVLDMLNVNLTTSRVKCAALVLEALFSALEEHDRRK